MNISRRNLIKLTTLSCVTIAQAETGAHIHNSSDDELLDINVIEDQKVETKIEQLKGLKITVKNIKDVSAEIALTWFFDEVKKEHSLSFAPQIMEQKNPISLMRWNANRSKRIVIADGIHDALDLFNAIFAQSMWHWGYSERGQVIIKAWHLGEQGKPEE